MVLGWFRDGFGTVSGWFRSREVSGRFRDGFGCPRPNFPWRKTKDLCATAESIWASELHFARVPSKSFFGVNLLIEGPILEGPPARKVREKWPISATPEFGRRRRRRGLPFRLYLHARISRITVVEHLPQIIIFWNNSSYC